MFTFVAENAITDPAEDERDVEWEDTAVPRDADALPEAPCH
ncbi:MAG: hypothetical protein Q8P41_17800 [Pseudomonadota bacterium]|nr:hypothetical protein [Pseudomonadota bacterium]